MLNRYSSLLAVFAVSVALAGASFCQTSDFDRAMVLFRQQNWPEAATAFAALEKQQPGQTDALLYQAKCLVNLGRFSDAGATLESYLSTHPRSDDAVYLLGYVRFRENRPKESLQKFTAGAKLRTPTADDLKIVSLDYVLLNDYADAGHYLEMALEMDPNNIEARYHLGRVRYQQNRFDEAIAAFQEVLKRDALNLKAENNLGLSLEAVNRTEPAVAAYHKAIELDERSLVHSEQPYLNLGMLLAKLNQPAAALIPLQQAAQIAPKSSQVRYELAKTLFSLHRDQESQQEVEEAVRLNPKDPPSHYLLGRIYRSLGKADLATQEFKLTEDLMRSPGANSGGAQAPGDPERK
jgi:tetratricopeptide (TPR) repeat protein